MLQQTQVGRVVEKYIQFIKTFPTIQVLATAPLSSVIVAWQGLGYNRRAKTLHQAVKIILEKHEGIFPRTITELDALPGIGHATASAILAYAFNEPTVYIETNIRSVFIHHFFPKKKTVHDNELLPYIEIALDKKQPRTWYSALMDYGAMLKLKKGNASRNSAHYTKQKTFKGSARHARGALLRELSKNTFLTLTKTKEITGRHYEHATTSLSADGLIRIDKNRVTLA
jgi:A/G-specific adenine glycosylase